MPRTTRSGVLVGWAVNAVCFWEVCSKIKGHGEYAGLDIYFPDHEDGGLGLCWFNGLGWAVEGGYGNGKVKCSEGGIGLYLQGF